MPIAEKSALPLLVLLIRADHAHDASPTHDLALVANSLDRRSDFHAPTFFSIRPRPASLAASSTATRSPTTRRTKFLPAPPTTCAVTSCPVSSTTRYSARGRIAAILPLTVT